MFDLFKARSISLKAADADVFLLDVLVNAVLAALATDPALLRPAERSLGGGYGARVHAHDTKVKLFAKVKRTLDVRGVHVRR